jgi:MraZ protein
MGRWVSFTGEFHHTIDAKGRLIVPARLRDELEDNKLTLTVWPEGCISLWSGEGWRTLNEQLLSQRRSNPSARAAVRAVFSQAHSDVVDKQGRISIPQNLRDFAGIARDVVIAGSGDHAEIWSPDQYEQQQQGVDEAGLGALFEDLEI